VIIVYSFIEESIRHGLMDHVTIEVQNRFGMEKMQPKGMVQETHGGTMKHKNLKNVIYHVDGRELKRTCSYFLTTISPALNS
jgi:hypothetical protein